MIDTPFGFFFHISHLVRRIYSVLTKFIKFKYNIYNAKFILLIYMVVELLYFLRNYFFIIFHTWSKLYKFDLEKKRIRHIQTKRQEYT